MGDTETTDGTAPDDVITRVRLDELSGEVVITKWHGDVKISEHREPARED